MTPSPAPRTRSLALVSLAIVAPLVVSGLRPYDRVTWILEVFPILIALPVLWLTHRRFPLTPLLYACIVLHALVLMTGGAYTYARVPLGFEVASLFGLTRNPYDRLGHFFQGFVPALVAREIFIRRDVVRGAKMRAFLVVCVVLAISATYELVEWAAAVALGQGADEFLGTQGDPWDTQSDMAMALVGGVTALVTLSRVQDWQISRLESGAATQS